MSNYKGRLQELCQKRHIEIPIYTTEKLPSASHIPLFQSTIITQLLEVPVWGQISGTKKSAENSAAHEALKIIEVEFEQKKFIWTGKPMAILIDIENQAKALDHILNHFDVTQSNIMIFVFLSEYSALIHSLPESSENIKIITCKSYRQDAADTLLILETGKLLSENTFDQFMIISQDHFAKTLEEIIISYGKQAKMISGDIRKSLQSDPFV